MQLQLTIELGGEGMEDGYEAYQAIAQSNISRVREGNIGGGEFRDSNGETVGAWKISEPRTPEQIAEDLEAEFMQENDYGYDFADALANVDMTANFLSSLIVRAVREARA
jgi:hypothetical protein